MIYIWLGLMFWILKEDGPFLGEQIWNPVILKCFVPSFFVFKLAKNVKDRERQTKKTTNNLYGNQCMNFEQASSSDLADKVCRMIAKTVLLNVSAALISPFG